jgi:hypothetical protein
MPELNAASTRSCLLGRVNFAGWPHLTGEPETEAFRASGGVKVSRIQDPVNSWLLFVFCNLTMRLCIMHYRIRAIDVL